MDFSPVAPQQHPPMHQDSPRAQQGRAGALRRVWRVLWAVSCVLRWHAAGMAGWPIAGKVRTRHASDMGDMDDDIAAVLRLADGSVVLIWRTTDGAVTSACVEPDGHVVGLPAPGASGPGGRH